MSVQPTESIGNSEARYEKNRDFTDVSSNSWTSNETASDTADKPLSFEDRLRTNIDIDNPNMLLYVFLWVTVFFTNW